MWTPAPDKNVQSLLTGTEPFDTLVDYHSVLSRGALQQFFETGSVIPETAFEIEGLFVIAKGELTVRTKSGSQREIARLGSGDRIFSERVGVYPVTITASTSALIFALPFSATEVVWHDTASRDLLLDGALRLDEVTPGSSSESRRHEPREECLNQQAVHRVSQPKSPTESPRLPGGGIRRYVPQSPILSISAIPSQPQVRQNHRAIKRLLVALVTCVALAAIALWLVPVRERMVVDGVLTFSGRVKPVTVGVESELLEYKTAPGARIEAGAQVAVLKVVLDTTRIKELAKTATTAKGEAEKILRVVQNSSGETPAVVATLAKDRLSYLSDLRILRAVKRGTSLDAGLTESEFRKFFSLLPKVDGTTPTEKPLDEDRNEMAFTDGAVKRVDLNEAEEELRAAKAELSLQQAAVNDLRALAGDSKEAMADYHAATVALKKRNAAVHKKSEIVALRNKAMKAAYRGSAIAQASAAPLLPIATGPDFDMQIDSIQNLLTDCEAQIHAYADNALKKAEAAENETTRLLQAAVPRPVLSNFAGVIAPDSLLTTGSILAAGTKIVNVITEFRWKADFIIPKEIASQVRTGMQLVVQLDEPQTRIVGTVTSPASLGGELSVRLQGSREDLRSGLTVRSEIEVVTGNLLTQMLGIIHRLRP